jgi:multiple sugar transport system permease protein
MTLTTVEEPRRAVDAVVRRRPRRHRGRATPYVLIMPALLLIAAFLAYPVGSVFYYSLRNYNVSQPYDNGFVGLGNFRQMLHDSLFWQTLGFSAKWVVVEVVLQLLLGLGIALIVNERFKGRGLARALAFSPWAVSGVLTTTIWLLLYTPSTGFMKYASDLGLGGSSSALLADPHSVFPAIVVAELWRGVPFFAILLLADLQGISGTLYEAASVDGAGRLRRFFHVTLPHMRSAIVLSTLLRAVWEFNNVDLIYTLTGGGPANHTTTLPVYVAEQAVNSQNFGYGSALTAAGFLILLFCSVLYLRLTKFGRQEEA